LPPGLRQLPRIRLSSLGPRLAHGAALVCAIARREKKQRNASHSDWPALPATYNGNDQRNPDRQHEDFHPGHRSCPR
jgi:hypothetical protein